MSHIMLDSRWSIFRSYLLSLRVLVSGSILFLATGVIDAQTALANDLTEQEPSPQLSESSTTQAQKPVESLPSPAEAAKTSPAQTDNDKTRSATPKVRSQAQGRPTAIAPLPPSKRVSQTEADLVAQIADSPSTAMKQIQYQLPT